MYTRKSLFIIFTLSLFFAIGCHYVETHLEFKNFYLFAAAVYGWIPGVVALYFFRKEGREFSGLNPFKKLFFLAAFLPFLITIFSILFGYFTGGFSTSSLTHLVKSYGITVGIKSVDVMIGFFALYGVSLFASISINYYLTLGEELFWRGYLWEKLRFLGVKSALLPMTLLYSLWSVPQTLLLTYDGKDFVFLKLLLMVLRNFALMPLFIYFREKEQGIQSAAVFHAMINTFCPIMVVFFPMQNQFVTGPLGICAIGSTLLFSSYFYLRIRHREQQAA